MWIFASINLLSVIPESDGGLEVAIFVEHVSDAVVPDRPMQAMHVAVSIGCFHDCAGSLANITHNSVHLAIVFVAQAVISVAKLVDPLLVGAVFVVDKGSLIYDIDCLTFPGFQQSDSLLAFLACQCFQGDASCHLDLVSLVPVISEQRHSHRLDLFPEA